MDALVKLARQGVPQAMRHHVYMTLSGAAATRDASAGVYPSLCARVEAGEVPADIASVMRAGMKQHFHCLYQPEQI